MFLPEMENFIQKDKERKIRSGANIRYRMCCIILSQARIGSSKFDDKHANLRKNKTYSALYIHSKGTLKTYLAIVQRYGNWLISRGMRLCSIEQALTRAAEYIGALRSKFYQKTVRSALARVFGIPGKEICQVGQRHACDIVRGRKITPREVVIRIRYCLVVEILRSLGLRKNREVWQIQPRNFFHRNGMLYLHVIGKGGRPRNVPVIGPGRAIIEADLASGRFASDQTMYYIPGDANVHSYRADYAARALKYAYEHNMMSGRSFYHGIDCGCLDFVSHVLGHGNRRYYTVFFNYLSYGVAYR